MIPPNIKEEIEKKAQEYAKAYEDEWFTIRDCYLKAATQFYIRDCYLKAATQFYLKGVGDRDAIVRAVFEAGRKGAELKGYDYKDEECDVFTGRMMTAKVVFDYPNYVDYLASDEYKKLVGGI